MIALTQNQRARLLTSLRQGVVVLSILYLTITGALGLETIVKNSEAASSEHQVSVAQQQVHNTQREIARAQSLALVSAPSDLSAVARLQSAVDRLAAEQNCNVADFHASSEVLPYISRFAKTTAANDWGQVEAQVNLAGPVKNVMSTLSGLLQEGVPFEFDALEITRDKVDSAGDATVIAHATLRVLIRTSKD